MKFVLATALIVNLTTVVAVAAEPTILTDTVTHVRDGDTIGWFARDANTLVKVGGVLLGAESGEQKLARLVIAEDAYEVAGDGVYRAH